MWDDVGILRDAAGLARAGARLHELDERLHRTGVAGGDLRYNLTWHDWLNLDNLLATSAAIRAAAEARTDSRGAHFREDFPDTGPLESSAFSRVRFSPSPLGEGRGEGQREGRGERYQVSWKPVAFTRVRPGQSLVA
jgi:fumarate reductase flavoprotein subunit